MSEEDFFHDLLSAAYESGKECRREGLDLTSSGVYDVFEADIFAATDNWLDHLENTTTLYFTAEGREYEYEKTYNAVLDEWNKGFDE